MINKKHLRKAKYLMKQKNGVLLLVTRALAFGLHPIFSYEKYHLIVFDLVMANKTAKIKGDISNTRIVMISNINDLEKLISGNNQFQLFLLENNFMENYHLKLDTGGLLFLLVNVKENEIMCSNWVSLTSKTHKTMNTSCYSVDFNKEAHLGGLYTHQKYRGLGYSRYLTLEASKYLLSIGKTHWKSAISKNNDSSLRSASALGAKIYGETKYLKILFFTRWKEQLYSHGHA
jgi:hypothetical protein